MESLSLPRQVSKVMRSNKKSMRLGRKLARLNHAGSWLPDRHCSRRNVKSKKSRPGFAEAGKHMVHVNIMIKAPQKVLCFRSFHSAKSCCSTPYVRSINLYWHLYVVSAVITKVGRLFKSASLIKGYRRLLLCT